MAGDNFRLLLDRLYETMETMEQDEIEKEIGNHPISTYFMDEDEEELDLELDEIVAGRSRSGNLGYVLVLFASLTHYEENVYWFLHEDSRYLVDISDDKIPTIIGQLDKDDRYEPIIDFDGEGLYNFCLRMEDDETIRPLRYDVDEGLI